MLAVLGLCGRRVSTRALSSTFASVGRRPLPPALLFDQIVAECQREIASNNFELARQRGEEALAFARQQKNDLAEGVAVELLGSLGHRFGAFDWALTYLEQAAAKGSNRQRMKELLFGCYVALGRDRQAVALWQKDDELRGRLGRSAGELVAASRCHRSVHAADESLVALLTDCLTALGSRRDTAYERIALLSELGSCCRDAGRFDAAIEHYKQALSVASQSGLWYPLLRLYKELARFYEATDDREAALDYWTKSANLAEDVADMHTAADCFLAMGRCIDLPADRQRAVNFYKNALEIAQRLHSTHSDAVAAEALTRLIDVHASLRQHRAALDYEQRMVDHLQQQKTRQHSAAAADDDDPVALTNAVVAVGSRQLLLGQPRKAVHLYQSALEAARRPGVDLSATALPRAAALCQISYAFQLMSELDVSERFAVAGLQLVESSASLLNNSQTRTHVRLLNNLGLCRIDQGATADGEELLNKAAALAEQLDSPSLRAMTAINHGVALVSQGAWQQARARFVAAQEFCYRHPRLSESTHTARLFGHAGLLALNEGDDKHARQLFKKQLYLATQARDPWGMSFALRNQAMLHIYDRDYKKALEMLSRHVNHALTLEQRVAAISSLDFALHVNSLMGMPPKSAVELHKLAKALENSRKEDPLLNAQPGE